MTLSEKLGKKKPLANLPPPETDAAAMAAQTDGLPTPQTPFPRVGGELDVLLDGSGTMKAHEADERRLVPFGGELLDRLDPSLRDLVWGQVGVMSPPSQAAFRLGDAAYSGVRPWREVTVPAVPFGGWSPIPCWLAGHARRVQEWRAAAVTPHRKRVAKHTVLVFTDGKISGIPGSPAEVERVVEEDFACWDAWVEEDRVKVVVVVGDGDYHEPTLRRVFSRSPGEFRVHVASDLYTSGPEVLGIVLAELLAVSRAASGLNLPDGPVTLASGLVIHPREE